MKKLVLIIAIFLGVTACKTNPFTGKSTLNFYPNSQVFPTAFAEYDQFLNENKVVKTGEEAAMIKKVGQRISSAAERWLSANGYQGYLKDYKWEYNLVNDETVNAWCMPGGKVVFYTGIMPICANENGVAAVMGHEVAHAFAKHGQERMSISQGQQIGGLLLALGTSNSDPKKQQMWNTFYGIGSGLGTLKFSRVHEQEADRLGLVFMLMAGYDGTEAAEVWVRMSKLSNGSSTPQILSTHPSNESRIQDLKNYLPTAKMYAKKYNQPVFQVKK